MKERQRDLQQGSIIIYILIAIFLTGLLVATMTQGSKKSAESTQLDNMMLFLQNDIQTVQNNIDECVQTYQNNRLCSDPTTCEYASQDTGNPNVPFPAYSGGTYNGSGGALSTIICPRAPASQQMIFTDAIGAGLKLLNDSANYTATYFNTTGDGVYIRVIRAVSDPLWTEALNRLPAKYSACSTVVDTTSAGCSGAGQGCFYYFILRKTGVGHIFPACP